MEQVFKSNLTLIIVSTLIVLVLGAAVALYFQKKTKTSEDWAIGGRTLPLYVLVFTLFATQIGGGILVGHVGVGYNFGIAPIAYAFCGVAGLLIMTGIAKWLRENEFTTIPDILRKIYGENKTIQIFSALMAMIVPFGWIASQITAFAKLYTMITGIDMNIIIVVIAIICVLFTIPAGFNSVAWSDFIFGVMMLVLCIITGAQALNMGGGWSNIVSGLPDPSVIKFPGGMFSAGLRTTLIWFVAATPGMMTNQMTFQRVCAADTVKNARKTLILSAVLIVLVEIWVIIIGNTCRFLNPTIGGENATGWFLTQIPSWTVALFAGFISTTIITTTDSAMQSVSVNFVHDIYKIYINPDADDKKQIRVSRIVTVVVAILSILLAVSFPQVLNLLIISYSFAASGLLVPIYVGYILRKKYNLTPISGIMGMATGLIGCGIAHTMNTGIPYAIIGITISLVGMLITVAIENSKQKAV